MTIIISLFIYFNQLNGTKAQEVKTPKLYLIEKKYHN